MVLIRWKKKGVLIYNGIGYKRTPGEEDIVVDRYGKNLTENGEATLIRTGVENDNPRGFWDGYDDNSGDCEAMASD